MFIVEGLPTKDSWVKTLFTNVVEGPWVVAYSIEYACWVAAQSQLRIIVRPSKTSKEDDCERSARSLVEVLNRLERRRSQ